MMKKKKITWNVSGGTVRANSSNLDEDEDNDEDEDEDEDEVEDESKHQYEHEHEYDNEHDQEHEHEYEHEHEHDFLTQHGAAEFQCQDVELKVSGHLEKQLKISQEVEARPNKNFSCK